MTRRLVCAIAICAYAASASAGDSGVLEVFTSRARAYVTLDAAARGASRQGDLFTPGVAKDFRKIIRKAFDGKDARNMRRTIRDLISVSMAIRCRSRPRHRLCRCATPGSASGSCFVDMRGRPYCLPSKFSADNSANSAGVAQR